MEQLLLQKKNKQNIDRLNSIIHEYEHKLDYRVNLVVSQMINYTKKIADPPLPPILWDKKIQSQKHIEKNVKPRTKTKSHSQYSDISFLTDTSLNAEVSQLRNTFKDRDNSTSVIINEGGRTGGKMPIGRPKAIKRKADVLPREIRLNPLHERNAIKAYELDRGILSLIEKGKIGKDVNIITAFEKGRPVLQTQKAIFHQGEERFAELEGEREELSALSMQQRDNIQQRDKQKTEKFVDIREKMYEDSWALTMPKEDLSAPRQYSSIGPQTREMNSQSLILPFKEQTYIKIQHYNPIKDDHYKSVMNKHQIYKPELIQLLQQISRVMKIYSIQIGYADTSKLLDHATKTRRLDKKQLLNCIVGYKNGNFKSLKNIRGQAEKLQLCLQKVVSSLRANVERKAFLKYMEKKRIANRIYGWAVSCWTVKKHRQLIIQNRKQMLEDYNVLQNKFKSTCHQIQQNKHYEILLMNQQFPTKQQYRDILNLQLTNIFNIKNINKHIVYLLPHHIDQETINYYYKIMELEEIPNYKDRVTFIQVDPHKQFSNNVDLSHKLYYNSSVLRKLKRRVKDSPAYFLVSYPSQINIKIASYLNIPIFGGSLNTTLHIQKRSFLDSFQMQTLDKFVVDSGKHQNLISLADEISSYCQSNKRVHKYIVKINHSNKSKGLALLSAPFFSLPQMYSSTALVTEGTDVDAFYHTLLKKGGVIEKYQQNVYFVSVVAEITSKGDVSILGTFQKISSGFVNIAYSFPQKKIENTYLLDRSKEVCDKLVQSDHYGPVELTFVVNDIQDIYLQKVQCYPTHLSSAIHYYKFLSDGELTESGEYMAKIVDTFEGEGKEEEVITFEPRSFCYIPYLLHFGLSDRQVNSFFQLCRIGGVSFDLENKYGATFILLGSMKTSMGLITTAKDKKACIKLMLKSLQFVLKQNSHNMSNATLQQKQTRMKERQNIINIKQRLQHL